MQNIPLSFQPTYDPFSVQPMRDELVAVGFDELMEPEDIDAAIQNNAGKSVFIVINSVCGCAAGSARPGASLALQHKTIPDKLYTVFAGQEKAAVDRLRRQYLSEFPPSSPAMALFKDGEAIFMLHRYQIEGRNAQQIAEILMQVFQEHCSNEGPSIPPEQFEKVVHAKACGSKIPLFNG
ncbi:MAG: BrxA/BrxB family bacilliredoxin [Deferribacteres bacterium]|nr:BrxA/BrxB family bacilliredoxin [candidate division KSB1 bacterium]MCB9511979.1 BrxA/BrxB family bacilliredoxin [Deferribacteres bacterium]